MATTKANILTGRAKVFYKAYTATPTTPVAANALSTTGYTELGGKSEDGLDLEYAGEFLDIKDDEHNAPVAKVLTGESLKVSFTLIESDLKQMAAAIAGATYTAGTAGSAPNTLKIGDGTAVEVSLLVVGVASSGKEFAVWLPRVMATGTVAPNFSKKKARQIKFEFEALAELTQVAGSTLVIMYEIM